MSWLNDNFISRFFVTVINWFYSFTGSYLLAVILFTLAVRLLLLPLDIRQRKAQLKQTAVAGKVKEIQERFKHDPAMAPVSYTHLERGVNYPTFDTLEKIMDVLEVTPNELLSGEWKFEIGRATCRERV